MDLQFGEVHVVLESYQGIFKVREFLEGDVGVLILLEYFKLDEQLMMAPTIGPQHNNSLLQAFRLNRRRKVPAVPQQHLIINNSEGKLPSIILATPHPITNPANIHMKPFISVDLPQTKRSCAFVLYDIPWRDLHDFGEDLELVLNTVH